MINPKYHFFKYILNSNIGGQCCQNSRANQNSSLAQICNNKVGPFAFLLFESKGTHSYKDESVMKCIHSMLHHLSVIS